MSIKTLPSLVSENTITFSRIRNLKCLSYDLFVKEYSNNTINEYLLSNIPNPKTENPIDENKNLEYNQNQKWELPNDVIGVGSKAIKVYINASELSTNNYTYSEKMKVLYIHIDLCENDYIEIRYKVDRIKYVHKTMNKCEYSVTPVFAKTYTMGQHSLL